MTKVKSMDRSWNSGRLFVIIWMFHFYLFCSAPYVVFAAQSESSSQPVNTQPWQINADKISYDKQQNIYTATGNAVIQKDDKTLRADTIMFNQSSMVASASGHIEIKVNQDRLSGDKVEINLATGTGYIENGRIFIEKNHFIICGDKIAKTGDATYLIHRGSLTTCDGETPDWKITGNDFDLTLEGYGTAKNTVLWTKKIPALYVPYFIFPLKVRRQSGLLPPQLQYSNRKGAEYLQPCFWAINRSSDATFYFDHMQYRGEKIGGEYRYALDAPSKGTLMMDSLNDKKIDDGIDDHSSDWGFSGDNVLRPNSDRYWFRMKADQSMPYQFITKLDLDVVSDQDYLREFSTGITGYNTTKNYFESEFGRDIDDKNDPIRRNNFNISRNWTTYSFTTDVTWNDNVIDRRQKDTDTTLQQLPNMQFYGLKQPLLNNLFYGDLGSEYTYFYRKDGQTGHRGNANPRLYMPYHYQNYFAFEPSIGFQQTDWCLDRKDPNLSDIDAHQNRELYDIRNDLSTDISKIFDINGKSIDKIKHTIVPKMEYEYVPHLDQKDFPQFDELDNIPPQNSITFSLTNIITSKDKIADEEDNNPQKPLISPYHQLCRFLLEQPYLFEKSIPSDEKPLNPLYAELDLAPVDCMTVGTETKWSHKQSKIISNNFFSQLCDKRGDRLYLEQRYSEDQSQSIYFDGIGALTQSFSIYGEYERNLKDGQDISKAIGFVYRAQCWSIEMGVEHEDNDKKVGLMINLNGLGGMGNSMMGSIHPENELPNYHPLQYY